MGRCGVGSYGTEVAVTGSLLSRFFQFLVEKRVGGTSRPPYSLKLSFAFLKVGIDLRLMSKIESDGSIYLLQV